MKMLSWLPPATPRKHAAFDYLKEKVGAVVPMTPFPEDSNSIMPWSTVYYQQIGAFKAPKEFYRKYYGDLLLAEHLLHAKNIWRRRAGLAMVWQTVSIAWDYQHDYPFIVDLYEGWLLPNLTLEAPESWVAPINRQAVLQGAWAIYKTVGETDRSICALQILVRGSAQINEADWARFQLAQIYQTRGQYPTALYWLNAIISPSMSGLKADIPMLEEKIRQQKQKTSDKTTLAKDQNVPHQP